LRSADDLDDTSSDEEPSVTMAGSRTFPPVSQV
jgi:hypothetical protein